MKPKLRAVSAVNSIAEGAGNPLLRGIPDPRTDEDLVRLIAHDPFRDPTWKARNTNVRRLPDALQSVFVPTPGALRLARTLFEVLHNGYDRRDPRKPGVWVNFHKPIEGVTYGEASPTFTDGLAISGITGLGKSHQVCRVLSVIPQTIYHDNLGRRLTGITQIVWIYLDMNTASGLEALLLELLEKIDDLLGVQLYRKQFEGSRVNIDRLINTVIRVLKTHFCGMLVLDEIQRLNFGLKQASERVRNLMLKLLNVGIPVVLVGNPLGLQFKEKLGVSGQLIRRLKANGYVRLNPADSSTDEEWQTLVRGLWRCQILPERTPLSVPLIDLLYRLTGGFPKFLSHLLAFSQQLAITTGERKLSLELIERAAHTSPLLREMHPLINAFVTCDALGLRTFSDIDTEYYIQKWGTDQPDAHLLTRPSSMPQRRTQQEVLKKEQIKAKAAKTRGKNKSVVSAAASKTQTDGFLQEIMSIIRHPPKA